MYFLHFSLVLRFLDLCDYIDDPENSSLDPVEFEKLMLPVPDSKHLPRVHTV